MSAPPSGETTGNTLPSAFNLYWAGQALSALGDAMTIVAMPFVVLALTGSIAEMGRLTAFARVGGLVACAGAGFLVDRLRPRRIMLACDVLRALAMALIPIAAAFAFHRMWLVYAVGICAALGQGIFYVGHVSLVTELVGRARVSLANSRVEGSIALAYVFGPFLAGLLSAHFGAATVLGLDSITFVVSALSLFLMAHRSSSQSMSPASALEPAPPASRAIVGLDGLRFIRSDPELSRLTILVALGQFFTAAIVDLFIFRLKHDLGQSDTGTGVTFGIASAAAVAASAATPWLRANVSFHRLWVAAVVLQACAVVGSAFSRSFVVVTAAAAVYMAVMTALLICQASLRQELTPQHLLGRVTSSYLVLIALPTPIGALYGTALAARFGASYFQTFIGVGLLATAALASALWARMPKAPNVRP